MCGDTGDCAVRTPVVRDRITTRQPDVILGLGEQRCAVLRAGSTGPDEPRIADLPRCDQAALLGSLDLTVDRRAGTPTQAITSAAAARCTP
jgi:hypothetical protein